MTKEISDTLISELSSFVNAKTGLHFPPERWRDLKRSIQTVAPDLGFSDTEACIRWILSTPLTKDQINIIVGHLTIGETFFFRDRAVFDALRDRILMPWARSERGFDRQLRFWSAACCTGEEPYSLAMLLDEMAGVFRGWKITIMATDINSRFIEKAKEGIYTEWSFRDMPHRLMTRYFTKIGRNRYEIVPRIKRMVTFSQRNLIDEVPVSLPDGGDTADVIFCRNVLMYLSSDMRNRVLHRLCRTLATDGWLVVSPSETAFVEVPGLCAVRMPGVILHRKGTWQQTTSKTVEPLVPRSVPLRRDRAREMLSIPSQGAVGSLNPKKGFASKPIDVNEPMTGDQEATLYQEALTLFDQRRYQDVIEALRGALPQGSVAGHASYRPEIASILARSYANLGRLEEAKKWGEKAVFWDKLNSDHYAILATIYQEMGLRREPIEALKRAIYLEPDRIMAHFMLGHLFDQQGMTNEAKRAFASALDLLSSLEPDEMVPYSEGLKAGRLMETIELVMQGN